MPRGHWIWLWLVVLFPQSMLAFYASGGLVGRRAPARELVIPALLLSTVAALVRSLLSLDGWYVVVFLVSFITLARAFHLGSAIEAVVAGSLVFVLIALGDLVVVFPLWHFLGIPYDTVSENLWLFAVSGWLETLFLGIGALLVRYRGLVLIPVAAWTRELQERRQGR